MPGNADSSSGPQDLRSFLFAPDPSPVPATNPQDSNPSSAGGDLVSLVRWLAPKVAHGFWSFLKGLYTLWTNPTYWWASLGITIGAIALIASLIFRGGGPSQGASNGNTPPAVLTPTQAAQQRQQLTSSLDQGRRILKAMGYSDSDIRLPQNMIMMTHGAAIVAAERQGADGIAGTAGTDSPGVTLVAGPLSPSNYVSLEQMNVDRYLDALSQVRSPQSIVPVSAIVHGEKTADLPL